MHFRSVYLAIGGHLRFGTALVAVCVGWAAQYAVPFTWRPSETADPARLQVLDDRSGDRYERVVVTRHVLARPELACLAQRLFDIEQEFVPRDWAVVVVHVPNIA